MNTCKDCGRYTKKGYQLKGVLRCDGCWEDWLRRATRQDTYVRAIGHGTDRDRRAKHRSVEA